MKISPTKQKVLSAASRLFFLKGFHGTSVRDIAEAASVNISLISYYFNGKQGLLEYAVTQYYEAYLETMEEAIQNSESMTPVEKMKELIFSIIQYKQNNHQFSCFIHRELSLDSVFVREMAVTYLAKENYLISTTFMEVVKERKKGQMDRLFLLMQLKGMLTTPYVLHNEWKDQLIGDYSHTQFVKNYTQTINDWVDYIVHHDGAVNNSILNS